MSVSIISDVNMVQGDPNSLLKEIKEVRAQRSTQQAQTTQRTTTEQNADDAGALDPRFKGKSAAEIATMYKNLESHSGRLATDLGRTQQAVQELIVDKRARDLRANGDRQPVTVDPTELLQRPTEALEPYIEERVSRVLGPMAEKLQRLETALSSTIFATHHSDASEIVNSQEFANWSRETQLRRELSASAANGNTAHADLLLSEFKSTRKQREKVVEDAGDKGLEEAGKVSLEQTRTGSDTGTKVTGKIYKRADIIALKMRGEVDDDVSAEIDRAYREGRVR
jgi:hypothetical protein